MQLGEITLFYAVVLMRCRAALETTYFLGFILGSLCVGLSLISA